MCISTHSPLVQSEGPTASVSPPKAFTRTSEIHTSPIQAVDLEFVSRLSFSGLRISVSFVGCHVASAEERKRNPIITERVLGPNTDVINHLRFNLGIEVDALRIVLDFYMNPNPSNCCAKV